MPKVVDSLRLQRDWYRETSQKSVTLFEEFCFISQDCKKAQHNKERYRQVCEAVHACCCQVRGDQLLLWTSRVLFDRVTNRGTLCLALGKHLVQCRNDIETPVFFR